MARSPLPVRSCRLGTRLTASGISRRKRPGPAPSDPNLSLFDTKREGDRASGEGQEVVEVAENLIESGLFFARMLLEVGGNEHTSQLATNRPEEGDD